MENENNLSAYKQLKLVKPLEQDGCFFCPVCDKRIYNSVKQHPYCGVRFTWKTERFPFVPVNSLLELTRFSAQSIARRVGVHQTTASMQMRGRHKLDYRMLKVLVDELEALKIRVEQTLAVLKRLKEELDV